MNDQPKPSPSSETGLDPKVSTLLAYLLGIVGGIVFYAISKDSFVKFHAMQSILLWVAMGILWGVFLVLSFVVPFISFVTWIIYLGLVAMWIVMMVKSYQGERYKLPIIGDMAERYAK